MASFYKKARDRGKKRSSWYFDYTDENGKRRTMKGFTDRGETQQLAARLEHEAELRRRGLIDPATVRVAERRKRPLSEHLDAFQAKLGKTTAKHVTLTMSRVRKVVDGCGFHNAGDIDAEAVHAFVAAFCEEKKLGHRTFNHYIQAFGAFCNWLVETGRLSANPVASIQPLNAEVDVRHKRRALSSEEFALLVRSARDSGEDIQCFTGEERARIYILSLMTGLRRKEIASLTPRSFNLDDAIPTLTVAAACSKHRKTDVLPLHSELVRLLKVWLKDAPADQLLFPKLGKRRTWLMVKKDLARAGIPYETPEGIADFHAAGRHSHITGLFKAGVPLPTAQKLARHADIKMTMRYTHVGMEDRAKALEALSCQCFGSVSAVRKGHAEASDGASCPKGDEESLDASPAPVSPSGTGRQKKTPPVKGGVLWRRRESNACPASGKCDGANDLRQGASDVSVFCPCLDAADCRFASPHDAMLTALIATWRSLSIEMKQAILRMANVAET